MSRLLFDTHCHLTDPRFAPDLAQILQNFEQDGLALALIPGYDAASSQAAALLASAHAALYCAAGIHPHDAGQWLHGAGQVAGQACGQIDTQGAGRADWQTMAQADGHPAIQATAQIGLQPAAQIAALLAHPKCVALGEIGLDYHYPDIDKTVQMQAFEGQLELACAHQKPVIIHMRDAEGDTLPTLKRFCNRLPGGVMHCFSGSAETAKTALDMGFYISFAGSVTFKNARRVQEAAGYVPLDRLLIETDAPYLAPEPHRGARSCPAYVAHVADKLAEIKGLPSETLRRATLANGLALFGIKHG